MEWGSAEWKQDETIAVIMNSMTWGITVRYGHGFVWGITLNKRLEDIQKRKQVK